MLFTTPQNKIQINALTKMFLKGYTEINLSAKINLKSKRQLLYSLYTLHSVFMPEVINEQFEFLRKYDLLKGAKMPNKLLPQDCMAKICKLADVDFKTLAFFNMQYILLIDAPHNATIFERLKKELLTDKIFVKAILLPISIFTPNSIEEFEAQESIPPTLKEWFSPYIQYKNTRLSSGITRDEEKYLLWLKEGKFDFVLQGTEKLLDTFPDEDGIIICNLAARSSMQGIEFAHQRQNLLNESLQIAQDAINRNSKKSYIFYYYRALSYIGLKDNANAKNSLSSSLKLNDEFAPAIELLKALNK